MPISQQDINTVYNQVLGRDATPGEAQSFLQYSNNGSISLTPFDITQILQGTPEYQKGQLQSFGNQLQNTLGASDQRILGLSQNALTQQFAQQGRNTGSSGYLNAYANAAANLAMGRQQQLANFFSPSAQGIMGQGFQQGQNAQAFGQGQQANTLNWNRQTQLMNYYTQLANQQNQYNRNAGLFGSIGSLAGGAFGAGIGGLFGGGSGAMLGANLGSGIGGGVGRYSAGTPNYSSFGGGF